MNTELAEHSGKTSMDEIQRNDSRSSTMSMVLDVDTINSITRVAEIMASGKATVPAHLRGNVGDCFAVTMQSIQWKMNPHAVGQKTHLVNGVLGYEAQLVNAVVQNSGAITGRFHYEYRGEGNSLSCRVGAIPRGEKEVVWNEWLCIATVTTKNSPLWKTNPPQQLGYLQVKNWARAYTPGAILGVYTPDELENRPAEVDVTQSTVEVLQPYPDDHFEKFFPKWKAAIDAGKQTPDDVIAKIKTRNTLTDLQESSIRACAQQGNVYENA